MKKQRPAPNAKTPAKLVERNLMGVNPTKQQFEPTPAQPVNQHKRMAGTC